MKRIILFLSIITIVFGLSACQKKDFYHVDDQPPLPPTNLQVLNGDNVVDLSWDYNQERDVAGYNVYYSSSYDGKYNLIGSTTKNYFTDYDARNGNTYYYAVTAYDYNGNESDLSYDNVNATPRPEGFNETVFDYNQFPDKGGFSFTTYTDVPYNDESSDFYFENYNGIYYIDVMTDTDIKDMGRTSDIYDIPYAPSGGWSPTKDALVIPGHTYVIWTWDNHYAKVRVSSATNERMIFDWAFQTVKGNTMLKTKSAVSKRGTVSLGVHNRK